MTTTKLERKKDAFSKLCNLYENAKTVKDLENILALESEFNLDSELIVVAEQCDDTYYSLRLKYFDNVVSNNILYLTTNISDLESIIKYYKKNPIVNNMKIKYISVHDMSELDNAEVIETIDYVYDPIVIEFDIEKLVPKKHILEFR